MALNKQDQTSIRDYLLGHLNDAEQETLEERLMVEDDLFEELEISKGELIEQYVSGELPQTEKSWFEQHYLASPEGQESLTFAIALGQHASAKPKPQPRNWIERVAAVILQPPWVAATAAAVVLALMIPMSFFFRRSSEYIATGPTLAPSMVNRGTPVLPANVIIPSGATKLKINLSLPQGIPSFVGFHADLDNRTEIQRVDAKFDANSVSVVIPVTQLPRGEYSLRLIGITQAGEEKPIPFNYLFNID